MRALEKIKGLPQGLRIPPRILNNTLGCALADGDGDGFSQNLSCLQGHGNGKLREPLLTGHSPVLSTWFLFSPYRFPRQPGPSFCRPWGQPPGPLPLLLLIPTEPLPSAGAVSPAHGSNQQPGALLIF
jgi:hypothetical protein